MTAQLSLAGFDLPAAPTDRLFFAILPDAGTAAKIEALGLSLRDELGLAGRLLAPGRFHITLHHLGDHAGVPQGIVAAAGEAAAKLAAKPFELAFDRVASFSGRPRKLPFVLRGDEQLASLVAFQQSLGRAMVLAGLGRWVEPRFTPHLTLLYDDVSVGERRIEPITWMARELVLVHSLLGQTTHIPLARWPLQA